MDRNTKVQEWRTRTKQNGINALGGKCARCGYNRCLGALDFHHINSNDKTDTIANFLRNPRKIPIIVEEIKKCCLLCSNCHQELHYGLWDLSEIEIPKFDESVNFYLLPRRQEFQCKTCGKLTLNFNYCSRQCSGKHKKIDWPTLEQLREMLNIYSQNVVGEKLGVSVQAIKKHIAKFYPNEYRNIYCSDIPIWIKSCGTKI